MEIWTFKIYYVDPKTLEQKSFKISGDDLDDIRANTIHKLQTKGVNTALNERAWRAVNITKKEVE